MKKKLIEHIAQDFAEMKRSLAHIIIKGNSNVLPRAQSEALFLISEQGTITPGKLALELRITRGAGTQLVDGLMEHGLLTRRHDEQDRRIVHIALSSKGKKQIESLRKEYLKGFQTVMDHMSETDLQTLSGLLQKINRRHHD
jgi:DNA-binding MarR family transcriptional regulator